MLSAEEKSLQVRQQVISKIHWGTDDDEVRNWLAQRHGIMGEAADALIAEAHADKFRAARGKALWTLMISSAALLISLGCFVAAYYTGYYISTVEVWILIGVSVVSLIFFAKGLLQYHAGEPQGSVD